MNVWNPLTDSVSQAWVPVISQGVTPAQVVTKALFTLTGKMVNLRAQIAFTSAGTAANAIVMSGLPTGYPIQASDLSIPIGTWIYKTSGGTYTTGVILATGVGTLNFYSTGVASPMGITPALTIANGDTLWINLLYPIA